MNKKLLLLPACMMLLASCTSPKPAPKPEPKHDGLSVETAWTAAEAIEAIDAVVEETTSSSSKILTTEKYYVKDVIKETTEYSAQYGNITFTMGETDALFTAYRVKKDVNGTATNIAATDPEAELQAGDTACIYGQLLNFKGTHECEQNSVIAAYEFGPNHQSPSHEEHEEPAVVNATCAEFVAATTDKTQLYNLSGKITKWAGENTDGTKYGNFYITDDDGVTELYVYGCTATATAMTFDAATGKYAFKNPQDFLTNEATKDLAIGSNVRLQVYRTVYNNVVEAVGILVPAN